MPTRYKSFDEIPSHHEMQRCMNLERAASRKAHIEGACSLSDDEIQDIELFNPDGADNVRRERRLAREQVAQPAPQPTPTVSALGAFEFTKGDTLDEAMMRNRTKAAPVVLVERIYTEFVDVLKDHAMNLSAISTKNSDRNFKIREIARVLGIAPGLPPLEDRGAWADGVVYYANDWIRHDGADWRCVAKHRSDGSNRPGSDGDLNIWETLDAPKVPPTDGDSVLERLAAVERALGLTPPTR